MSDLELLNDESGWKYWINAASPRLSAIAWDHFLTTGRGVFFIDFTAASCPRENVADVAVSFVREDQMLAKANEWDFSPDFFGALLESLYTYDPEQEIVFCLRKPNGDFASGVVGCTPSPPQSFLNRAGMRPVNIIQATINN